LVVKVGHVAGVLMQVFAPLPRAVARAGFWLDSFLSGGTDLEFASVRGSQFA
jgi:hypothetical protein